MDWEVAAMEKKLRSTYPSGRPGEHRGSRYAAPPWRRSVIRAARARPSGTAAATRWWPRSAASTRTSRRCGSWTAPLLAGCTCARAASRPARSQSPLRDPALVRFRGVVAGALAALEARRDEVNDLNVFPVADGDTGDNMALTLRAVLAELDRLAAEAGQIDKEIGRDEIVD